MGIEYLEALKNLIYLESITLTINIYRGGCALVWLAKNLQTHEVVALK